MECRECSTTKNSICLDSGTDLLSVAFTNLGISFNAVKVPAVNVHQLEAFLLLDYLLDCPVAITYFNAVRNKLSRSVCYDFFEVDYRINASNI